MKTRTLIIKKEREELWRGGRRMGRLTLKGRVAPAEDKQVVEFLAARVE